MIELAEIVDPRPQPWWALLKQVGVDRIVSLLDGGEQGRRWLHAGRAHGNGLVDQTAPPAGYRPWDHSMLERLWSTYADAGFEVVAMEDTPPMDLVRLGLPGRDEQIEWFQDQVRAMGRVGIPILCYNWIAVGSWARTDVERRLRGGALTTAYDHATAEAEAKIGLAEPIVSDDLWANLVYFLSAVIPVAEESGVLLAMHPDDPPLPEVRGVPRIMNTVGAFERLLQVAPSPNNGITMCQGNFALMSDDLPGLIRRFGDKIQFVHFRDVVGSSSSFSETFIDEGPTDLLACLEAYRDIGFNGVLRPDHVPTLAGESNDRPGYAILGRLHAIGYINGLRASVYRCQPRSSDVEAGADQSGRN